MSSSSILSVLIDKATSFSHKSAMIVNVKASVDGAAPEFLFLELVELQSQRAESIEEALLNWRLQGSVKSGFKITESHLFLMEPVSC